MDREKILNDIKNIISEVTEIEVEQIDENKDLFDELEIDSLDMENIIILIEDKYNIDIPNEKYENIYTISDIVDFILRND